MGLFAVAQLEKCGCWCLTGWPSLVYCIEHWAKIIVRRQTVNALNGSFHVGPRLIANMALAGILSLFKHVAN